MLDNARSSELAALLAWYRDMGVDHAVDESPVDWTSRGDRAPGHGFTHATPGEAAAPPAALAPPRPASCSTLQPPRPAPPLAAAPRQFPATAPDAAVMSARSQAREARTLADLEATLAGFDGCSLKATAKSLC